jgi:hypothetical protein
MLPSSIVRRLDRAAHRRKMSQAAAVRTARPLARAFVKHIVKTSDKRSAMLPIAVDIRFQGKPRKEAPSVSFELFRCEADGWHRLDSWISAPTVSVSGELIEQFGYTFFGQRHNETSRIFQQRLEQDFTHILAQLLTKPERKPLEDTASQPPVEVPQAPPTAPTPVVESGDDHTEIVDDED